MNYSKRHRETNLSSLSLSSSQSSHVSKKRRRNSVSFAVSVSSSCSSSQPAVVGNKQPECTTMITEDDAQCLWYQKNEISNFRKEARDYIFGAKTSETRGYERYDIVRAKKKSLALKCTLMAARKGYEEDDLALISQHCTASAQKQAFVTAFNDYCEAYSECLVDLVLSVDGDNKGDDNNNNNNSSTCTPPPATKRTFLNDDSCQSIVITPC